VESVLLVAPDDYDTKFRRRLEERWTVTEGAGPACVVEEHDTRVYLARNPYAPTELEPQELEEIRAVIPNPIFYTLDFTDILLCRSVLETIANDPRLLIDNDHGVRLSGTDFIRMLRSQRDWDWRRDKL